MGLLVALDKAGGSAIVNEDWAELYPHRSLEFIVLDRLELRAREPARDAPDVLEDHPRLIDR
jgi:hypothetical protein